MFIASAEHDRWLTVLTEPLVLESAPELPGVC
jgi:hypothetical protein